MVPPVLLLSAKLEVVDVEPTISPLGVGVGVDAAPPEADAERE